MLSACSDDPTTNPCDADPCFNGVTCTQDGDSFTCGECPAGYDGNGETCENADACGSDPCFEGVACTDEPPPSTGFTCDVCPAGREGDGATCTDSDGCKDDPCFTGVACSDVAAPGTGFTCDACPAGYDGDGETCSDTDGCAGGPCFAGVTCTDVAAPGTGFTCGDCPVGLDGTGESCTEIDGCATNTSTVTCFPNVACIDVAAPGIGFTCDDCPAGFVGDGFDCADIDGCATNTSTVTCFPNVACIDVPAPGSGFTCDNCPMGTQGDGFSCTDIDGCLTNTSTITCFPNVACVDVVAPGTGFGCDDCPLGYEGDGFICTDINGCDGGPCLAGTICADVPVPGTGFTCTQCQGPACPFLRALAGADQVIIAGTLTTLKGDATGFNGSFTCEWTNDQDATTITTCSATVAPVIDTIYTLEVTDVSQLTAQDSVTISTAAFIANAGPSQNIESTETATLTSSWQGASCADLSCISCAWALTDGTSVAQTCTTTVSPTATSEYVLTVTDTGNNNSASDSTTVFVTDQPAQLCGWDVVVMTSQSYATGANPNYICDGTGTARRQTVNGKPAIVLSDLRVSNVRITGTISVETGSDDDHIGFMWGWQDPRNFYFLNWKQGTQGFCGTGLSGIAIKKVDGSTLAPSTISFNPAFGFNATDYIYTCAMFWSTDRNDEALLGDNSIYLLSPRDVGAFTGGWQDFITYRVEFYYTPTQTKVVVWQDDPAVGPPVFVTDFVIVDSSYPEGAFAFYSNSQTQVAFGDFILASLQDFEALAGPDQTIQTGAAALLTGSAQLAVPPFLCEWSEGSLLIGATCDLPVMPIQDTVYELMVTDAFGNVSTDEMTVFLTP